jgi:hypothetical protein
LPELPVFWYFLSVGTFKVAPLSRHSTNFFPIRCIVRHLADGDKSPLKIGGETKKKSASLLLQSGCTRSETLKHEVTLRRGLE